MCEYVFKKLDLDYKKYVIINKIYLRPTELKYLKGDSLPAREKLKWSPKYTFYNLMDEMIEHWLNFYSKN